MGKFKLQGPLESDVQAWILASLGTPVVELRATKTGRKMVKVGLWIARDGSMFWRANSGGRPDANGRIVRGNPAGTPDILGCVRGRLVGLEVKREGEKQRPAQVQWQQWIEAAGGVYAVVRSPGEAREVINGILG